VVGQPEEDISDSKVLGHGATATKCWPKYAKITQNWR